ncbi:hypothetical protein FCM35_KLT08725 [Carex littledalei]|uniref:Reverse transcriptase zinc-binding domain-containing protein n=1 Tax=Carex littledalei TaxID=544730 RepID=A0A833QFE2_9POAL|nr:hypothetical protein FCM35_KLT08725 [Carex littledalei]
MCYMCRASDEDAKHLFNDCTQSKTITSKALLALQISEPTQSSQGYIEMMVVDKTITTTTRETIVTTNFIIWKERCNRIFRDTTKTTQQLVDEIIEMRRRDGRLQTSINMDHG